MKAPLGKNVWQALHKRTSHNYEQGLKNILNVKGKPLEHTMSGFRDGLNNAIQQLVQMGVIELVDDPPIEDKDGE